ncbi:hypothetical protein TIFTF001_034110 [Ficus carica]|uniref:Uncharacterized protein n=1 Tax=Ficus carica TaxID=3494 RepID=A0AA88E357_FICCA|nr:hypothetical protein TIFTF001_034110 [Ficus carica]
MPSPEMKQSTRGGKGVRDATSRRPEAGNRRSSRSSLVRECGFSPIFVLHETATETKTSTVREFQMFATSRRRRRW